MGTELCNDVKELNKLCQVQLKYAVRDLKKAGVNPLIVETYRSQARQNMLYAQGRTTKGSVITWTKNSKHTLRTAVDVIPQRDGKAIWNTNDKETQKIIATMSKYGFEAGANWKNTPDSPHFQIADVSGTTYSASNTNTYITKMIQKALNEKINAKLKVDGIWGPSVTAAVNKFRVKCKYLKTGKVGTKCLAKLIG